MPFQIAKDLQQLGFDERGIAWTTDEYRDTEVDYADHVNANLTHDQIEFKLTGYGWTVYPHLFTENNGHRYFSAPDYKTAQLASIKFCIEILKRKKEDVEQWITEFINVQK